MNDNHGLKTETKDGEEQTILGCHTEGQAIRVIRGADFRYCPFCGDKLKDDLSMDNGGSIDE